MYLLIVWIIQLEADSSVEKGAFSHLLSSEIIHEKKALSLWPGKW